MTTNDTFDRRLAAWLDADARGRVPDHLSEVLVVTRATRQRPGWSSLERWLPMATIAQQRFLVPKPALMLLVVAALLTVALVGVYLVGSGDSDDIPFGEAKNGRIVFVDGSQIVSAPSESFKDRMVAGRVDGANGLAVSPDGTRLAYAGAANIAITDIPGGETSGRAGVTITAPGMTQYGSPAWSPSGNEIAFVGADSRTDHVFVANADGSNVREIAAEMIGPNHVVGLVGFSPDGRWIAFAESPDPGAGRLVIVATDGTESRVLATSPIDMGDGAGVFWSPDKATPRILYLAQGGVTRYFDLTNDTDVTVATGFWPSWSPTGDRISYWSDGTKIVSTPTTGGSPSARIDVFPSFSGACQDHPELAGEALCGPVVWSPDGTRVVGTEITGDGLLSLRADGSGVPVLFGLDTNVNPGEGGIVAWQPVYPE